MALTGEEKGELAKRIARGVQVLCSSIAQLHLGSPNPAVRPFEDDTGIVTSLRQYGADKWKFTNIEGALLLTKDQHGVVHFRIYDLQQYKLRFQYELYEEINYEQLSDQVHCFEMENCMCSFSFSSVAVATKFYKRVQANKPKRSLQQNAPYRQANTPLATSQGFESSSFNNGRTNKAKTMGGSSKGSFKSSSAGTPKEIFLGNGMLDPNNVPGEWKKILKKAGIKKKDLKNPKMFEIIKETLTSHNIELDPPTDYNFDDPRLKQYYTPSQIEEWKQYQLQMRQFEADQRRYEQEMAEYERQEAKQRKLDALMKQQESQQPNHGAMTGRDRLRQSVAKNHGSAMSNFSRLLPAAGGQQMQMPRMSVARPMVPALPVIPKEERIAQMVGARASRVIMKTSMLEGLKGGGVDLRRVSVLPTIKNKSVGEQNNILATLKQRLIEQRMNVGGQDADDEGNDSGSEWDDE